jgi:hypothetical protein
MGQGLQYTCRGRHLCDCHPIPVFLQRKDSRKLRSNADTWFRLEGPDWLTAAIRWRMARS